MGMESQIPAMRSQIPAMESQIPAMLSGFTILQIYDYIINYKFLACPWFLDQLFFLIFFDFLFF